MDAKILKGFVLAQAVAEWIAGREGVTMRDVVEIQPLPEQSAGVDMLFVEVPGFKMTQAIRFKTYVNKELEAWVRFAMVPTGTGRFVVVLDEGATDGR